MNPYMSPQANPYLRQSQPIMQNAINWVQGIEGGKAFQLLPNSNAIMLDSENEGIFYIKTSDNVGMCNLRIFKFEEITEKQLKPDLSSNFSLDEYVKKSELESLVNQMLGGNTNEQTIQSTKSSKPTITE